MKYAVVLFVAFACSGGFASEPSTPLDCSDWVFLEPGYSCSERRVCDDNQIGGGCYVGDDRMQIDVASGLLWQSRFQNGAMCGAVPLSRIEVYRQADVRTVIGYVDERCVEPSGIHGEVHDGIGTFGGLRFDSSNGQLLINFNSVQGGSAPVYSPRYVLLAITGFATTFDILQTFTPQPALGFRVPYMPEGMAGADHFDTYWGNLAHPIDFTQAHPLACDYPATPPHVGDYLTVADTVPTPAPGQGVYYVTSATYQGATRYGRKAIAGLLTGRDPSLLPGCTP